MTAEYFYPLTVAGVRITLKTVRPLQVTKRFAPFASNPDDQGYLAEFREVSELPEPVGKPVWSDSRFEVFYDERYGFWRRYFHALHENICFAAVRNDWTAKRILAEYIPEEQALVSEMGNCFSFSGWETILLRERRLILHAACVDTPAGGLLFSGPSGIGKSTQAELWRRYADARLINGDRPILHKSQKEWKAYGSPYAGSSNCFLNESCRIKAIVMLRQAPECSLRRMGRAEAFHSVFSGITVSTWDASCVMRACELAEELILDLPVYEFFCTPDRRAVEMLLKEVREGVNG